MTGKKADNSRLRQGITLLAACVCWLVTATAAALGTSAGVSIENTATASFDIAGTPQTPVSSNTTQTLVDELIEVVVVSDNGGAVGVGTPQSSAVLQFTVTNNGNGAEAFRLIADAAVAEGGFDPTVNQLYLESNGVPGLQPGADTAYITGSADPLLAEDEVLTVYVEAAIPAGLAQNDAGDIELRAVAVTVFNQAGTDDPGDPAWPLPGTAYAGLGNGGGDAVVGVAHDNTNLVLLADGRFQVSAAVLAVVKTVLQVLDPFGGATVVPGSVITYQLEISVAGTGNADNVALSDVLPVALEYEADSLTIDGVAEDDDFAPAATDTSGYDANLRAVLVNRASLAAGGAPTVVTFAASVR